MDNLFTFLFLNAQQVLIIFLPLGMNLFNFHHHHKSLFYGIYNLNWGENTPESHFSVGIHPKDINENWEERFNEIRKISKLKNCLAIGECGLDSLVSVEENFQKKVFKKHILWANEIQKPVIIHCVKKFQDLIPFQEIAQTPLIIHGFNRKKNIAEEMLKHGFYLSFGKSVLYNLSLQIVLKNVPLERLFLETDATDLEIKVLHKKVAEIKCVSVGKLQNQILKNLECINIRI